MESQPLLLRSCGVVSSRAWRSTCPSKRRAGLAHVPLTCRRCAARVRRHRALVSPGPGSGPGRSPGTTKQGRHPVPAHVRKLRTPRELWSARRKRTDARSPTLRYGDSRRNRPVPFKRVFSRPPLRPRLRCAAARPIPRDRRRRVEWPLWIDLATPLPSYAPDNAVRTTA